MYNLEITPICCDFNMVKFTISLVYILFHLKSWLCTIWDIQKVSVILDLYVQVDYFWGNIHCHAGLGRHGSAVVRLICMPSLSYLGVYSIVLFLYCGITGFGSASFCNGASRWSQSPSLDTQCKVDIYWVMETFKTNQESV